MVERGCFKSNVEPAFLYGSETCRLLESEMGILRGIMTSMVRAMCSTQLKDIKRAKDLILMLGLNEID